MSETIAPVDDWRVLDAVQQAQPELLEPLRSTKLVALYGPTCIGRTALIDGVLQTATDMFGRLETAADRPPLPYTLAEVVPEARETIRRLPWGSLQEYAVITPAGPWHRRFDARYPGRDRPARAAALQSVAGSLDWCLDQPDLLWFVNGGERIMPSAVALRKIILGECRPHPAGRYMAGQLLKSIVERQVA